jgi:hypothetical protein
VWKADEYAKLPAYDGYTGDQPLGVFLCHQQDGRVCAGWAGCHDMENTLAIRFAVAEGRLDTETIEAIFDYETDVPLWASGAEAAAHGLAAVYDPDADARRVIDNLEGKKARRGE